MRNFQQPLIAKLISTILLCLIILSITNSIVSAQQKEKNAQVTPQPTLMRTTTKHEVRRFGYGSSLTIIGAPAGSIIIEAWSKSEVDITADIELHAATEEDLALLSTVNSFTLDEDVNHI